MLTPTTYSIAYWCLQLGYEDLYWMDLYKPDLCFIVMQVQVPSQCQHTTIGADVFKDSKKTPKKRGPNPDSVLPCIWHLGVKDAILSFDTVPFNKTSVKFVMVRSCLFKAKLRDARANSMKVVYSPDSFPEQMPIFYWASLPGTSFWAESLMAVLSVSEQSCITRRQITAGANWPTTLAECKQMHI